MLNKKFSIQFNSTPFPYLSYNFPTTSTTVPLSGKIQIKYDLHKYKQRALAAVCLQNVQYFITKGGVTY